MQSFCGSKDRDVFNVSPYHMGWQKNPASCGCALWSTSVTARFSSEKLEKRNTQGKKDSVTNLDEVRFDILCTTAWNRHCQRNGWTALWYFQLPTLLLSRPRVTLNSFSFQMYGPTECLACSWRKDSVHRILDVSTARWSADINPCKWHEKKSTFLGDFQVDDQQSPPTPPPKKKRRKKKRGPKKASTDPTRTSGWR